MVSMLPIIPPTEWLDKGFDRVGEKHVADPTSSDRPTMYLYGNSILREAGKYMDEHELCKTHDLVLNCKGGNVNVTLEEHPIPPLRHENDIVVLSFIGNLSLTYEKYGKPDEMWHYTQPRVLDDAAVNSLIDKIISTVATVRKTFKGTIKVIGPTPRLLSECCDDPSHLFSPPLPFNASPHNPAIAYYAALNQFLVCHPKLAAMTAEIIPYQIIWLNKPGFDESCLKDNLHLGEEANKHLSTFLARLPQWRTKSYKLMDLDSAFRTWTALFYGWGKKKAQVLDPTTVQQAHNKTKPVPLSTSGSNGKPPAPPQPPALPGQTPENMDATNDKGPGSSTISEFLETSAAETESAKNKNKNKNAASKKK